MRHRALLLAGAVPVAFACLLPAPSGPRPGDTVAGVLDTSIAACPPSDAPELELGLGHEGFAPMPDAATAERGAQGGQHLWLAFRAAGLDLSDASVVWVVGDADGERHVDQVARLSWTCLDDEGVAEVVGLQVPLPAAALGRVLDLEVTLTDAADRSVGASASLRVD